MKNDVVANINNVPAYATMPEKGGFIVARLIDTALWFYGFYDTLDDAQRVSRDIGDAVVLERKPE